MCNNDNLLKIFDCLNGYEVIYNCEKITSLENIIIIILILIIGL